MLLLLLVLVIFSLALNSKHILSELFPNKIVFVFAFAAIAYGVLLRECLSEQGHKVFFDEYDRFDVVLMWMKDVFNQPSFTHFPGIMMAYYPIYKILGIATSEAGYQISIFFFAVSAVLVYIIANKLWNDASLSLLALLLFSTYPVSLLFAGSQTVEIANTLFSLATFLAFLIHCEKRSFASKLFFASSLSFTIFVRPYNIVFVCYLLTAWLFCVKKASMIDNVSSEPRLSHQRRLYTTITSLVFISIIGLSYILTLYYYGIDGTFAFHYDDNFLIVRFKNLTANMLYFVDNNAHPLPLTIVIVIGLLMLKKGYFKAKDKTSVVLLVGWIACYFSSHIASIYNYALVKQGDAARYTLDFYAPLLMLTAFFLKKMVDLSGRFNKALIIVIAIYIATIPFQYARVVKYETSFSGSVNYLSGIINGINPDSTFATNSALINTALRIDKNINSRMIRHRNDIQSADCAPSKCVFFILQPNQIVDAAGRGKLCGSAYRSELFTLLVCDLTEVNALPDYLTKQY